MLLSLMLSYDELLISPSSIQDDMAALYYTQSLVTTSVIPWEILSGAKDLQIAELTWLT
jgi:hypothetical protein